MKKRNLIVLTLFLLILTFFPGQAFAQNSVSVYIDGEYISFDVPPKIINDRTMVPMRKIFEHLGAEVYWYEESRTIDAFAEDLSLTIKVDDHRMYINERFETLDVAPMIIDGRTLVPLRAVAEAFSAKVDYDGVTRTVSIWTQNPDPGKVPIQAGEFDAKHVRTSYGNYEYIDFYINGNILTVSGVIRQDGVNSLAVDLTDKDFLPQNIIPIRSGEVFRIDVDLSEDVISDKGVKIFTKKDGDILYWTYINRGLLIESNGQDYRFKDSLVYENNKNFMAQWVDPLDYLNAAVDDELVELSNAICADAYSEYEKILKIHDWVAENIYYNFDYFYGASTDITYDALGVYRSKRSVCEGYANLTQALVQAQNIPCRKVSAYALGLGEKNIWSEETANAQKSNHALVQAYVDDRWINIDATWDSRNRYEDGQFIYEGIRNHHYFDISDIFFSYSHKYIY